MTPQSTRIKIGEQFCKDFSFQAEAIANFATLVGDTNPVHYDISFANALGFENIIVSGPHTSALLTAMLADHFSRLAPTLGLDYNVKFNRPILVGKPCRFSWQVVAVTPKQSLRGELVSLVGTVTQNDCVSIAATATVAVMFSAFNQNTAQWRCS